MRGNLHIHTTVSDGFLTPEEVVTVAGYARLTHIAVTDHDAVGGVARAVEAGRAKGVYVIPGIEMTSIVGKDSIHILGLGVDPEHSALTSFLVPRIEQRYAVVHEAIEKVNGHLGANLTLEEVVGESQTPTKSLLANAMVRRGLATDKRAAIETYLNPGKPCYVSIREDKAPPEQVLQIIHDAGGRAFWAHPAYPFKTEGQKHDDVLQRLMKGGLDGIEAVFDYENYEERVAPTRMALDKVVRDNGLLISGGSDYHCDDLRPFIGRPVVGRAVLEPLLAKQL